MRRKAFVGVVTAFAVVAAGAGAVQALALGSHADNATIRAKLVEWKMTLLPAQVAAGKVTFVVRNTGFQKHELVVIRTNRAPNALPVKGYEASEVGSQGEIEDILPGQTKQLTLTLRIGKYVAICNLAKHYKRGQHAGFTVG
jgi:uncharacterized cupredoxin-like copper-binding protein